MDKGQSSKQCHTIPGPADRVQAALRKLAKGKEKLALAAAGQPFDSDSDEEARQMEESTQQYIARAVLEAEFDDSFTKIPWETVKSKGYTHGYSSMKTINDDFFFNRFMRIPLVVGIVNTLTPNGLGDAMLELKDETDHMPGSITRNVLGDVNFAGKIEVGAVLVLEEIAAVKLGKIPYLNITNKNVKLVIAKDGEILDPSVPETPPDYPDYWGRS